MDQARLFNRRRFLAAAPAAAALFVPRRVLGGAGQTPPSEQLNVAVIGTGGQGIVNIQNLLKHPDVNIAAICDVAEFWDNSQLYYRHHGGRGPAMQALAEHGRKVGAEWCVGSVSGETKPGLSRIASRIASV